MKPRRRGASPSRWAISLPILRLPNLLSLEVQSAFHSGGDDGSVELSSIASSALPGDDAPLGS
jgi:hypothetical protein